MIKEEALAALGLTKIDAQVCVTLLARGPQRVADLERACGVHRRNLYDSLGRLENLGFVSAFIRNDKKYFQIASKDLLDEKLREQKEAISEFILEMQKVEQVRGIPEVHILVGERGIKILLDDEARCGKPIYGVASSGFEKAIWNYLDKTPHRAIALPIRLIYTESDVENRKRALAHGNVSVRTVPDEHKSPVALELYGDTSCIILENTIIRMKDRDVSARFRMFFDTLWRMGKDVKTGK